MCVGQRVKLAWSWEGLQTWNIEDFFLFSLCLYPTELKVRPGEDSILQCRGPRDDVIILLEWRRSDLKSDTYVFFFRNQRLYENYQHEFFKGRVELRDPSMKDGDVSVILKNVSTSDTGTCECEITTRNKEGVMTETKHSVNLTVTTSGFTDEDTKDGGDKDGGDKDKLLPVKILSVLIFLLMIAAIAINICRNQMLNS
ncbi:hypothetical protein ACER0C_002051 [Sarotherodon galilaeus]